jgi:CDP-glucose 4,6-dehydratase
VFHLAAQTQVGVTNRNPVSTWTANIAGTAAMLEAARRSPAVAQIVTASSDKAYGVQAELPYDEAMPLLARNPYDVSKACADLLATSYWHTWGVPVCVTRCGNFFGPGDLNWERLVPGTIRSLLEARRPVIRSDGTLVRDYLYVVDGALSYLQLAEAMAGDPALCGEAFNFSNEEPMTVLEVVNSLRRLSGRDLEPEILAGAAHEIPAQHLSATKARKLLGWSPRWTTEGALAETVTWYRNYLAGGQ